MQRRGSPLVRLDAREDAASGRGAFRRIPHFRSADADIQAVLGRIFGLVSRDGQAGLRTAYRPADARRHDRIFRQTDADAASVHAFRHGRNLAGHRAAARRRERLARTDARTCPLRRNAARTGRTAQRDRHGRAQRSQAAQPARQGAAGAPSDCRRELSSGNSARCCARRQT